MKIKMMKAFDMLGIPLTVVVKNYLTMVTAVTVDAVHWLFRIIIMSIMFSLLLRARVKMSMCF